MAKFLSVSGRLLRPTISRSPDLSTALECDEENSSSAQDPSQRSTTRPPSDERSPVPKLLKPASESDEEDDSTSSESGGPSSTTLATTLTATTSNSTSISRMENGHPIPRLAVGPYHQRPAPILTETTKLPTKRDAKESEADESAMRGPPPAWNPPRPPNGEDEEEQYDEPDVNQPFLRTPTAPPYAGAYEISTSQQALLRRQQEEAEAGATGKILVKDPETGSYYVPSGHTTMSSLSPQSSGNRYEKTCMLAGPNQVIRQMHPHQMPPGGYPPNPFEPLIKAPMPPMERPPKKKKVQKFFDYDDGDRWKKICLFLLILLAGSFIAILCLLVSLRRGSPNYTLYEDAAPSIYSSVAASHNPPGTNKPAPMLALPDSFQLGELVSADLPPGRIVYTQFSVQHNSHVTFNISVGPRAQLVLYGRQTVLPSPSVHDFQHIIRADKLHLSLASKPAAPEGAAERLRRGLPAPSDSSHFQALRSTIFAQFLLAGRWHLAFLNDADTPQPISFIATVSEARDLSVYGEGERLDDCKYDCFGKGTCKDGKCVCYPGYSGAFCEDSSCPVLCTGNGVFANGRCICHEGYKGVDCDMLAHWCDVPNCNQHGQCSSEGRCICDHGWSGEFCDKKDCEDPKCSSHGVCHEGQCYCEYGWKGSTCAEAFTWQSMCQPYQTSSKPSADFHRYHPNGVIEQPNPPTVSIEQPKKVEELGGVAEPDPACSNNGFIDIDSGYCNCLAGFTGTKCEKKTCAFECHNGGSCSDEGFCECEIGWTGQDCTTKACLPGCEEHGECREGVCYCSQGWNGENCHIEGCVNKCNGSGSCQVLNGIWQCFCDSQHFGPNCELSIESDCDDGIDNDGDGLVDCEDSECCNYRSCSSDSLCASVVQPRDVLLHVQPTPNANFYQRTRFLVQPDSVQSYADERQFNESRVAVIRGRVVTDAGAPLTGVRVSDVDHPLYGFTLTRSQDGGGAFDLMVNGGGHVTLQFMRQPFERLEKTFAVAWNRIVYVGDVVMSTKGQDKGSVEAKIEDHCRRYHSEHTISPKIVPSWKMSQYGGAVGQGAQMLADSRIIFDSVEIPGTSGLHLTYSSERAERHESALLIRLLPATLPADLRLVHVKIAIVGTLTEKVLSAKPNLSYTFYWDQLNVYVQSVNGLITARVSVGYEYKSCKGDDQIVWRHSDAQMDGRKSRKLSLGMWSFDIHHHYDFMNNVLERGDGRTIYLDQTPPVMATVLGTGSRRAISCPTCIDENAQNTQLFSPVALAAGADGSIYVGDFNMIRRLSPSGLEVDTLLELSTADTAHAYHLTVDPTSGNLFVSLPLRRQIWMVTKVDGRPTDPTMNYQIFAGDGSTCAEMGGSCGDGGPADSAQLAFPKGMAFDAKTGTMYVADGRRLRAISKQRQITTVIKDKMWKPMNTCVASGDIEDLNLEWPTSVVVDQSSGDVLIQDSDRIHRLNLRAGFSRLVGAPSGCQDGSRLAALQGVAAMALTPSGDSLYVAETDGKRMHQIRKISFDGSDISTVAGRTSKCDCDRANCPCDDSTGAAPTAATHSYLHTPSALAVRPDGQLFIADQGNYKVKTIKTLRAKYDPIKRHFKINSPHTNEIFIFNRNGMHVSTQSLLSGQHIYNFSYNIDTSLGRLTKITGIGGFALHINRVNDTDQYLETSTGSRTGLRLHTFHETLERISFPDRGFVHFDYLAGQLLRSKTIDSRSWLFDYDAAGQATNLTDPDGHSYGIARQTVDDKATVDTVVERAGEEYKKLTFNSDGIFRETEGRQKRKVTINTDSFVIEADGYRTQFDGTTHPLLLPHESAILKRKIIVPPLDNPPSRELSSRFEWRGYVRRESSGSGRKIVQVNGRNVFTVEYDRQKATDTIRNAQDHEILQVEYSHGGQVSSIQPSVNLQLAPLNISYDTFGRQKRVIWGATRRHDFSYDSKNRLLASTVGPVGNLLARKYNYHKDDEYPSLVQLPSGEKFRWRYDRSHDGIKVSSLKTPSNEIHAFKTVGAILQEDDANLVNVRATLHQGNAGIGGFTAALNAKNELVTFSTPDRSHRLSIQRDIQGRVEKISADDREISFFYEQSSTTVDGGELFRREEMNQGPVTVAIKENRPKDKASAYFALGYDDLFRPTTVQVNIDGVAIESLVFGYDDASGQVNKVKNFQLLKDAGVNRVIGETAILESQHNQERSLTQQKLIVANNKVLEAKYFYDVAGRVEAVQWTVSGVKRPLERRTYNINGQLAQLIVGERDEHRWNLHYDLDGRLKALNNEKILLGPGGVCKKYDEEEYKVDANGWVTQKGGAVYDYDVFGHLKRVEMGEKWIEYEYDEKSRITVRRNSDGRVKQFYYALPEKEFLITHFTDSANADTVYTIHYTAEDEPFAFEGGGSRYTLIRNTDASVRFIFNDHGNMVRELVHSPTGETVLDTNPALWLPIGFHGHFDDPEAEVIFVRDGGYTRSLDAKTGRFMSTSPSVASGSLDVYNPELEGDVFRYVQSGSHPGALVPTHIDQWFKLAGIELPNLVPALRLLHGRRLDSQNDWEDVGRLCDSKSSTIFSAALCAVKPNVRHFEQFLTVENSRVQPPFVNTIDGLIAKPVSYMRSDSIGFLGVMVGPGGELRPRFADPIDAASREALALLLNGSRLVDADSFALYAHRMPAVEIHVHKSGPMDDLTNYGIVSREATLSKLLNITVDSDRITINGEDSKIVVHYQQNTDLIRAELVRYRNQHFANLVWVDEKRRLQAGNSVLRRNWSPSERSQLLEQGVVSGYKPMFVPGHRKPDAANLRLWTFDRA
ncbi:hypothetical protein QR680_011539 [Steinernema hermaphroditum]|uniref:EGF-like domain-containing protein n=1 Tax=Steinernema hermaphroditum TaxID=289476 RepID=A0AA39HYU2_9BILA|nr:hypothetical protein QR680_011539 [Steinernema hermaphroditum]